MKTNDIDRRRERQDMTVAFFDFINRRHRIHHRNRNSWPWTHDDILRTYRFTNVFRPLDAVSQDCKRKVWISIARRRRERAAHLVGA